MTQFKTAEEFKSLPEEEQLAIAKEIAGAEGYACFTQYIDCEREREVFQELRKEYKRIEDLAYAIGGVLREHADEWEEEGLDASGALYEFMSGAATECERQYCGDYYDHDDGFWLPSNC